MKTKNILIFLVLAIAALLAIPMFVSRQGEHSVESLKPLYELNQGGAGKSWRVEKVLGRDAAQLFVQGQRCYLSRTLGAR